VLEANREYWDGAPALSGILLRIVANERTGYQALLAGDVDLMVLTPDLWREAQSSTRASRFARLRYTPMRVWYVGWNMDGSNPFFSDARVRRAMTLALDRERFASRVTGGLFRPAIGTFLPESFPEDGLEPWPYDPADAKRLLDEAGWKDTDGDGIRERGGAKLSFTLTYVVSSQEVVDRIAAWIQQSLAEVGVAARIEKMEWKAFQERRRDHRFEAAMATWTFTPLLDQFEIYHSSARDSGVNYGGFSDPEVDRLLEEGRRTFAVEARQDVYRRVRHRVHELEPVSFLFYMTAPALIDARLEGVRPNALGMWLYSPGARAWRWSGAGSRGD
jgi:peptide/nickel transport system substrate-binding protein